MKRKKDKGYESKFTKEQLGYIIFKLSDMLDSHIDAIWVASEDDEFLTPEMEEKFKKTQRDARFLTAAFAPHGYHGGAL